MPTIDEAVQRNVARLGDPGVTSPISSAPPIISSGAPPDVTISLPNRGTYPPDIVLDTDFAEAVAMPVGSLRAGILLSRGRRPAAKAAAASQQTTAGKATGQDTNPDGIPAQIASGAVSQEPYDSSRVLVSVAFVPAADAFFGGVQVWMSGYHTNKNPVLMTSGKLSPFAFIVDLTGETVTVILQAISPSGVTANLEGSPRALITLDGTFPAPPAPTVVQTTTPISGGFQFQFTFEAGNLQAQVTKYNVYRSQTANDFSMTRLLTTVAQSTGTATFQDTVAGTAYYFLSAVDVNGAESVIVSCQSGAIAAVSKVDPSSTHVLTKGSIPPTLSGSFTYTSTTTSITWSWTGLIIYRVDGTTTTIANGSQAVTGLTANTTYYFYPFYNELTGILQWVGGGTGSPAYAQTTKTAALGQAQSLQHHVTLSSGGMLAVTPVSGGGSGGGGGTTLCLREDMVVETPRGVVPIVEVEVGDLVMGKFCWQTVIGKNVRPWTDFIHIVTMKGREIIATPTHPFPLAADEGKRAAELTLSDVLQLRDGELDTIKKIEVIDTPSLKVTLTVEPNHEFYAGLISASILTHNINIPNS